jgi:hypothetical protein
VAFQKGQSGNPGGRKKIDGDLRELARSKCPKMLKILAEIAEDESKSTAARVTAASAVLDRGLGKPMQMVGDDDGNPISWIEFLTGARSRALRDEHDTVQ